MSRHSQARLRVIAELLPTVDVVADIGCGDLDLGRLVLARGRAQRVIAVERAPGAFARARARARADSRIDVRLGDGFDPLRPGEARAAVLAGMGGHSIARVLERAAARTPPQALPPVLLVGPNAAEEYACDALAACAFAVVECAVVAEGGRLRALIVAMRVGPWEGAAPPGGEVRCAHRQERAVGAGALRAAHAAERTAVWRRELAGASGARADSLRRAIMRVEATL